MKITPLEIRQKSFEKVFRGYDKDEVTAFLQTLSQEWERMVDEQKELRYKLEATQDEVKKLREVESSLFKTLKTAEDTGSNMVEQAKRTAELHMKETQMKAEAVISESRSKAKSMLEKAEHQSKQMIEAMEDEVKSLEQSYKALENYRENIIADLRTIANNTLEKADRANAQKDRFSLDGLLSKAKRISESFENQEPYDGDDDDDMSVNYQPTKYEGELAQKEDSFEQNDSDTPENAEVSDHAEANSDKKREGGSFFDQINE